MLVTAAHKLHLADAVGDVRGFASKAFAVPKRRQCRQNRHLPQDSRAPVCDGGRLKRFASGHKMA
jgi:hypothetical protein